MSACALAFTERDKDGDHYYCSEHGMGVRKRAGSKAPTRCGLGRLGPTAVRAYKVTLTFIVEARSRQEAIECALSKGVLDHSEAKRE